MKNLFWETILLKHLNWRAQAKASSVIQTYFETNKDETSVVVIGADQVVYIDNELFGKPKSNEEWKRRLHKFFLEDRIS